MDFRPTYTTEQEDFRREVRGWLSDNVPAGIELISHLLGSRRSIDQLHAHRSNRGCCSSHRRDLQRHRLEVHGGTLGRELGAKGWLGLPPPMSTAAAA